MAAPAERMKACARCGLREVRLVPPDARTHAVRARVTRAVARFDRADEPDALVWIESIAESDEPAPS